MDCKSIRSRSSSRMTWKYDVFVSFRGEDTRNNFTDHLFAALHRKCIDAFRDDTKLKKGDCISSELLQAIEGSRILIVVFSKNYASSTWCLQELANMADCIQVPGQSVLPVFYDVDPSEVRKQSGNYGTVFAEHEERFKENLEMMMQVQRWRRSLAQVATLSGWDVGDKPQYAEIEKIVKEVTSILGYKFSSPVGDLIGMQSRTEQLEKLLVLSSNDVVRVIGICGMGGIGKTTLATTLYDKISHQYDACCFIDDVSRIYEDYGPLSAQKQLLCQTLNEENLKICNLSKATYLIRTRLRHVRALIVLDNVDQDEQLEKLAVNRECLGAGSRVIIISRDEHILRKHGVDEVYNVQLLNFGNALQLFCTKAFKCDNILREYKEMTYDVVTYANGLPLAIKVLGSFLFGRNVFEWRSALARLRENPNKDIMDVLRVSFDALMEIEKEIFLDIACFFNGKEETYVKRILDCCGFHPHIGISVLIDKSLITIWDDTIRMHALLQELGRKIVREKSPKKPGNWSRLWLYEDLHDVMLEYTEIANPKAIVLEDSIFIGENTTLKTATLSKMRCLRLLILKGVKFSQSLNCLSNKLRYLEWYAYPFTCLPSSFQPNKLVELILPHSSIEQLWEGIKPLLNLRIMDLRHSKNLREMPDFRGIPNLEQLNLEGCTKLVHINPSLGFLRKLASLNLKNCKNLVSIPNNIFGFNSLEVLNLSGCSKLFNNHLLDKPRHTEHLEKLHISENAIQGQSTSSICERIMLPFDFFYTRTHKASDGLLLLSLPSFPFLRDLDLSFCNLLQIPNAIGWLLCLESLNLRGNNFISLPSIKDLSKLINLKLEHCQQLKYLPELPSCIVLPVRRELSWGEYGAGLYIFNCPKLGELERCSSMAFSWMIQVLQAHHESSASLHWIEIVIPESQIPRWFNNQCAGSSISIELAPILHDKTWIGFAVCAAFVVHDDRTNLNNQMKPWITCIFSGKGRGDFVEYPVLLEIDLVTVESDHICLLYFTRAQFINIISWLTEKTHNLDGIKFVSSTPNLRGLHLEVKNCGFRWVFKQDSEQLNPTMIGKGSSSIETHDDLGTGSSALSLDAGNWSE